MTFQTTKYKPYPAFEPSGVEWLGQIPTHWEVQRLKFVAHIEAGQSPPSDVVSDNVDGLPFLQGNSEFGAVCPSPRFACVQPPKTSSTGDILLSVRAPVGAVNIADQAYGIGRGLCAIQPSKTLDGRFAYFLLLAIRSRLSEVATGSTYDAVSTGDVGDLAAIVPPLPEQHAIAGFLARETAKIDSLVAKKERLIELLQEKRIALIGRAVTKGLDPNVPMKDSGVEWLGEIPAHWQVKRLKHLLRAPLQYGANEPSNHIDPDSPRYIRITDIREDGTLWDDTFRSIPQETAKPYLLAEGDLLFARSGATVGKTFKYHPNWGKAAYAGYLIRARLDEVLTDADYLEYFTHSQAYKDWILGTLIQSTIQNVSAERYASLAVPLPSLGEQQAISKHLDSETAKIDALVKKVREATERLKELRAALISAAVTGRIDVREEAV